MKTLDEIFQEIRTTGAMTMTVILIVIPFAVLLTFGLTVKKQARILAAIESHTHEVTDE